MNMNNLQRAYMSGRSSYMPLGGIDMQDIRCFYVEYSKDVVIGAIKNVLSQYKIFNYVINKEDCLTLSPKKYETNRIVVLDSYIENQESIMRLANSYIKEYISKVFDIEHSLWRVIVVNLIESGKVDKASCLVVLSFNGIIVDGYVISRIINEIFSYISKGEFSPSLSNNDLIINRELSIAQSYLENNFSGLQKPITLPWINNIEQLRFTKRNSFTIPIKKELFSQLSKQAAENGFFENTIYTLAVCKCLNKYVRYNDFVIAIPTSYSAIKSTCSNNSSFIPLRYREEPNSKLFEEALNLQNSIILSLENNIDGISVAQQLSSQLKTILPFPVVFTNGLNWDPLESVPGVKYLKGITETPQVALDIRFVHLNSDWIHLSLDYAEDALSRSFIISLAQDINSYLKKLSTELFTIKSPCEGMGDNLAERGKVMSEKFFIERIIYNIFDNASDSIALINNNQSVTYKKLGQKVYQAAQNLDIESITSNDVVALCIPKSFDHIYYTLACIFSGIIWLPLDANAPPERILFQLRNAKATAIVINRDNKHIEEIIRVKLKSIKCIILSENSEEIYSISNYANAKRWNYLKDYSSSYYLYTSGTTGIPKCVALNNIATNNTIQASIKQWKITHKDCVMSVTPFYHDMSLFDIFGTLCVGATLVLPEKDKVKDAFEWANLIEQFKVTIWVSVPAVTDMLLMAANSQQLTSIRLLAQGGDYIRIKTIRNLISINPNIKLYSLGGPTETTIWSIWHEINIDYDLEHYGCIPYGKPLVGNNYIILDKKNNECSATQVGNIAMSGINLSNGYIVNGELDFEGYKRVGKELEHWVYISKDIGFQEVDGVIIFKGREEGYLKIKGVRVSAAEVEKYILDIPSISQCIVVELPDEELSYSELAVAYVSDKTYQKSLQSLYTQELRKYLPEVSIPTKWYQLPELPLTPNGKFDRKEVRNTILNMKNGYISTHKIDSDKNITDDKNVENSGSILSDEKYKIFMELTQQEIQSAYISSNDELQRIATEYEQRVWLLHQQDPLSAAGPFMIALNLKGDLCLVKLMSCLYKLYDDDSAFNSCFFIEDKDGVLNRKLNKYKQHEVVELHQVENIKEGCDFLIEKLNQVINIESGPIIRFYVLAMKNNSCLLGIHSHHILMDNNSWSIILSKLSNLYNNNDVGYPISNGGMENLLVDSDPYIKEEYWSKKFKSGLTSFDFSKEFRFISNFNNGIKINNFFFKENKVSRCVLDIPNSQLNSYFKDLSLSTVVANFGSYLLSKTHSEFIDILIPVVDMSPVVSLNRLRNTSNVLPIRIENREYKKVNSVCKDIIEQITNGVINSLPYEKIINITNSDRNHLPNILVTEFDNPAKHINLVGVSHEIIDIPPVDSYYMITLAYCRNLKNNITRFELTTNKTIDPLITGLLLQDFINSLYIENSQEHISILKEKMENNKENINQTILHSIINVYSQVLKRELDKDDNFFDLGGHSLTATLAIGKLKTQYGLDIKINDIFTYQTPNELAYYISEIHKSDDTSNDYLPSESRAEFSTESEYKKNKYPITLLQKFYLEQAQLGKNKIFNIPFAFKLLGNIDSNILKEIFLDIIEHHTALRTIIIHNENTEAQQLVISMKDVNEQVWFNVYEAKDEKDAKDFVIKAGYNSFDLTKEIPIKVSYIQTKNNICYLSVLIYHSAFDEWSASIFIDEFISLLTSKLNKNTLNNQTQYKEYQTYQYYEYAIEEFHNRNSILEEGLYFWKQKLGTLTEQNGLLNCLDKCTLSADITPVDKVIPIKLSFNHIIKSSLMDLSLRLKTSLFQVIYSLIVLTLYKLGAGNNILIATSTSCRENPKYHNTIGLFTNVILNRVIIKPETSLFNLLCENQTAIMSAIRYSQTPFPFLLNELADPSANNLVEYYIQMHAGNPLNNITTQINGETLRLELLEQQYTEPKFGLHFEIYDEPLDQENSLVFLIHYMPGRYSIDSLKPLKESLISIIEKIGGIDLNTPINKINF